MGLVLALAFGIWISVRRSGKWSAICASNRGKGFAFYEYLLMSWHGETRLSGEME